MTWRVRQVQCRALRNGSTYNLISTHVPMQKPFGIMSRIVSGCSQPICRSLNTGTSLMQIKTPMLQSIITMAL